MSRSNGKKLRPRLWCEALEDRTVPATLEPGFTEAPYVSAAGLAGATGLAWAPDGTNRLYISRKAGDVRVIQNGALLPTAFSTDTVFTNSECGLIGMAFDRDYVSNGYIYLFMTVASNQQQIVRYTDADKNNVADAGSRLVIVSGLPTVGNNHDGGAVGIGFDNKLYWAIGDLGNGTGVDLDLTSLAAKVGRANLDGSIPRDNPFNDGPGPFPSNNDYIWARGFRNPFTFTFQESTGQLWMNVVGTSYEQIFKVNARDHAGYNDYEGNQPLPIPAAQYIRPKIIYKTNGTDARTITAGGAVRNGNVVTITHPAAAASVAFLQPGNKIIIGGVADGTFNGTFDILSVAANNLSFTYAQTGPNASSGGGTATTFDFPPAGGAAVTGGTFLNTTAVPAQYRGNFFFTDYIGGDVHRAALDAASNITSVNPFITTFDNAFSTVVDAAVGPDGAIYYVSAGGSNAVMRSAYTATGQGLWVTPTYQAFPEGGRVGLSVRLAQAPAGNVDVIAAHNGGDNDLSVFGGGLLTFTPANWFTPQVVTLAAAHDADILNDQASFSFSSIGLPTESFTYTAIDDDAVAPTITSAPVTTAVLNSPYSYDVNATGYPAPTYALTVFPAGMTIDANSGVISWTPTLPGPFTVTVEATNGVLPNATQTFQINANTQPAVQMLRINDTVDPTAPNSVQSRLTSITVTFGQPVNVGAGAFALSGFDVNNNPISVPTGNIAVAGNGTAVIRLTFTGTVGVNTTSLADGVWQLSIENTLISALSGGPTMAADYTGPSLFRLFGDADGNGTVDATDFSEFGAAFGGPNFDFDFDGNNTIDALDMANFGNRFGLSI